MCQEDCGMLRIITIYLCPLSLIMLEINEISKHKTPDQVAGMALYLLL